MAQYINFEAEAEFIDANSGKENDEVSLISESDSFIDDQEVEEDIDLYRQYQFSYVEKDINEVLAEAREEVLAETDQLDEVSNLCEGDYEPEIDGFKESNADIEKFEERSKKDIKKLKITFVRLYYMQYYMIKII